MKFISLILTIFALIWTWNIVHEMPNSDHDMHASLQSEIRERIVQSVLKKHPEAEKLNFGKLWTERKSSKKIEATFEYSYVLNSDRVQLEGSAQLLNIGSEAEPKWKMTVRMDRDVVEFQEGLTISPSN